MKSVSTSECLNLLLLATKMLNFVGLTQHLFSHRLEVGILPFSTGAVAGKPSWFRLLDLAVLATRAASVAVALH